MKDAIYCLVVVFTLSDNIFSKKHWTSLLRVPLFKKLYEFGEGHIPGTPSVKKKTFEKELQKKKNS